MAEAGRDDRRGNALWGSSRAGSDRKDAVVRPRAVLYASDEDADGAFSPDLLERMTELVDWIHIRPGEAPSRTDHTFLLTGWGAGRIPAELIMPGVSAVFHIGGSLHGLIPEDAWHPDLIAVSARRANAVSVAEYALACVIMAAKRATLFAHRLRTGDDYWSTAVRPTTGLYGSRIGIVGLSATARHLLTLLQHLDVSISVYDPTLSEGEIATAGAEPRDLDELIRWCDILSLHAPSVPVTRGMIDARRLAALHDGGTVINTARGDLIDTEALAAECASGRLFAYLDVTEPEPLPSDSALLTMESCFVTPHIAGAMGRDVHRLTTFILEELNRVIATGSTPYATSRDEQRLLA
ncbi:hydroxyacid dehydrogenase [Microbacterium bovistercoris]|uniref:Hydroxyacid dehydrogenase n=1 Tax=Microbacterium bovistercoris TaxID=2293570 RepID=A0A371NZ83_9MICO|nr:hydroxyacid dehydrogenase [Microbacterium bovistercoris]REJ08506.1 hydroxyacid dehydrogenase [Microbacterium bovistercoris]